MRRHFLPLLQTPNTHQYRLADVGSSTHLALTALSSVWADDTSSTLLALTTPPQCCVYYVVVYTDTCAADVMLSYLMWSCDLGWSIRMMVSRADSRASEVSSCLIVQLGELLSLWSTRTSIDSRLTVFLPTALLQTWQVFMLLSSLLLDLYLLA